MVSFMYITDGVWHCSLPFHVKRSPPSPKRRQPAWFPTPSRSRRTERNISSPVWPTETRRTWCCLGSGRMLYLDRYKLEQSMPTFRTYMLCGIHLFKWNLFVIFQIKISYTQYQNVLSITGKSFLGKFNVYASILIDSQWQLRRCGSGFTVTMGRSFVWTQVMMIM